MIRSIVVISVTALYAAPAFAQQYVYGAEPMDQRQMTIIAFIFVCTIALIAAVLEVQKGAALRAAPPPPPTPEELDQQAALMRAQTRKLQSETEYRNAFIAAARVKAESDEIERLLERLRDGSKDPR